MRNEIVKAVQIADQLGFIDMGKWATGDIKTIAKDTLPPVFIFFATYKLLSYLEERKANTKALTHG